MDTGRLTASGADRQLVLPMDLFTGLFAANAALAALAYRNRTGRTT